MKIDSAALVLDETITPTGVALWWLMEHHGEKIDPTWLKTYESRRTVADYQHLDLVDTVLLAEKAIFGTIWWCKPKGEGVARAFHLFLVQDNPFSPDCRMHEIITRAPRRALPGALT